MWIQALQILEPVSFALGLALVLFGVTSYGKRTAQWSAPVKIFFNRVSDLSVAEFKFIRYGSLILFIAVLVRIINLTVLPA
ncbi:hypothetical protein [Motilimonas pumila]|uniref:Uncharacterized protein n=1 Tax=Motilimonas pumila TaxID=2303987 RepID=A0A418YCL0_9GAMM|nr:hypothetical protein [Motilimonas pumila]RJG42267.1 hypothetical protein D1Z90_14290 [Motilimonas pumila]